jgi:hypothetical protein
MKIIKFIHELDKLNNDGWIWSIMEKKNVNFKFMNKKLNYMNYHIAFFLGQLILKF